MKQRAVFNSRKWYAAGGDGDVGDNSQFFETATILREYTDRFGRWLADVRFSDGRFSRGHFMDAMECPACMGHMRSTVGMKCETCGRDYMDAKPKPTKGY